MEEETQRTIISCKFTRKESLHPQWVIMKTGRSYVWGGELYIRIFTKQIIHIFLFKILHFEVGSSKIIL
jgi:hypothetical protein